MLRTAATWCGSPLCEPDATASSWSVNPKWSAAPDATTAAQISGFADERMNAGPSMSPTDDTIVPSGRASA
jgi:hypothetical protein